MPTRYHFSGPVLHFEAEGEYTWREASEVLEEALRDPAFVEGETLLLVNPRGSEYQPTYTELLEVARYMDGLSERLGGVAVVARDPLHRTLARMLAALVGYRGMAMDVLEDEAAADAWVAERTPRRKS